MSWVVDVSVLIQAYILEADTKRVYTLLAGLKNNPPDPLHIPEFAPLECANILWKHVRFSGMIEAQAEKSIDELLDLPLAIHISKHLLKRALKIGLAHQLAIYDSIYLALAENLNIPLITVDTKQAETAKKVGIQLKAITDFPEFSP